MSKMHVMMRSESESESQLPCSVSSHLFPEEMFTRYRTRIRGGFSATTPQVVNSPQNTLLMHHRLRKCTKGRHMGMYLPARCAIRDTYMQERASRARDCHFLSSCPEID